MGLLWTWSVVNGSAINGSVVNVVWYELVCYERGCGLLWVVCYERVCFERTPCWTPAPISRRASSGQKNSLKRKKKNPCSGNAADMCGTGIRHRSGNTCCKEKLWRGRQWMPAVSRCRQCIQQTQQKSQPRKQKTVSPHAHISTHQLQHTHHAISGKWGPHTVTGGCDTRRQYSNGNVHQLPRQNTNTPPRSLIKFG